MYSKNVGSGGGWTQDNTPMNMVPLMKDHEHGDSNQLDGEKKKKGESPRNGIFL